MFCNFNRVRYNFIHACSYRNSSNCAVRYGILCKSAKWLWSKSSWYIFRLKLFSITFFCFFFLRYRKLSLYVKYVFVCDVYSFFGTKLYTNILKEDFTFKLTKVILFNPQINYSKFSCFLFKSKRSSLLPKKLNIVEVNLIVNIHRYFEQNILVNIY